MANRAITIGVPHDEDKEPVVVTGPGVPYPEHREAFRKHTSKEHPEYRVLELWTSSGGLVKRKKFTAPAAPAKDAPKREAPKAAAKPEAPKASKAAEKGSSETGKAAESKS